MTRLASGDKSRDGQLHDNLKPLALGGSKTAKSADISMGPMKIVRRRGIESAHVNRHMFQCGPQRFRPSR
jgi:hypothetical protein